MNGEHGIMAFCPIQHPIGSTYESRSEIFLNLTHALLYSGRKGGLHFRHILDQISHQAKLCHTLDVDMTVPGCEQLLVVGHNSRVLPLKPGIIVTHTTVRETVQLVREPVLAQLRFSLLVAPSLSTVMDLVQWNLSYPDSLGPRGVQNSEMSVTLLKVRVTC